MTVCASVSPALVPHTAVVSRSSHAAIAPSGLTERISMFSEVIAHSGRDSHLRCLRSSKLHPSIGAIRRSFSVFNALLTAFRESALRSAERLSIGPFFFPSSVKNSCVFRMSGIESRSFPSARTVRIRSRVCVFTDLSRISRNGEMFKRICELPRRKFCFLRMTVTDKCCIFRR